MNDGLCEKCGKDKDNCKCAVFVTTYHYGIKEKCKNCNKYVCECGVIYTTKSGWTIKNGRYYTPDGYLCSPGKLVTMDDIIKMKNEGDIID